MTAGEGATGSAGAATLELHGLTRSFPGGAGVQGLTLAVQGGEILALLGPSGSGKTTTLRLLAGFDLPDSGRVLVAGQDVTRVPAVRRRFGMVFQHYALFPHLDVGRNVGFGLEGRGWDRAARAARVARALAAVDLAGFERRSVASLSGGQQQRVALARALAPEPRVLLLDEPLSNLDPALRERTRQELRELIRRVGITTVFVTHEQEEAFDLGDEVALLHAGRLEQQGRPEDLYDRPASPFVAGFIGRATTLAVEVLQVGPPARVRLPGGIVVGMPVGAPGPGPATACLRPEALRLAPPGTDFEGDVVQRRFLGAESLYTVRNGGLAVEVAGPIHGARLRDRVGLEFTGRGLFLFAGGTVS